MVTVEDKKTLEALKIHEDGEAFYVKDENKIYVWKDEDKSYKEVDQKMISEGGLKMNLYEINKSIISQMDPLDEAKINDLKDMVNSILDKNYYLLYGEEISYFTLFERKPQIIQDPKEDTSLGNMLIECLKAFDKVYNYELLDNGAIEIWVHNKDNNLATVLYLFDYTDGVVIYE